MPTSGLTIADHLLGMAYDLGRDGLWLGGPNFADPASMAVDVPAAAYRRATGVLPFLFALPTAEAAAIARTYIEATPVAMDILRALAGHIDRDWLDDPIDRLAHWPTLPGVTTAEVTDTLRALAHTLTITATAPAAAA